MANFSDRRVQTLTQVASQTPKLQTGASSLTGDVINAASFGLQTYQTLSAQNQLDQLAKEERAFQSKVQKGISDFERLQREVEASGITPVRANRQINQFLQNLGSPELSNAVLEGSKRLSGVSALGSISDAEQEALAARKEVDELQVQAAALSRYSTAPVMDIESASREELQSYVVQATANKANLEKQVLDMENNARGEANRANKALKMGSLEFNTLETNSFISQAKVMVREANLQDPASKTELINLLRDRKQVMTLEFQQYMQSNLNVSVSSSQAVEALAPVTAMIDSLVNEVIGTEVVNVGANHLEQVTQGMVASAMQRDPETVRMYLLAKDLKFPLAGFTDNAFASIYRATEDLSTKSTTAVAETLRQDLSAAGVPDAKIDEAVGLVRQMSTQASNNFKDLTERDRENLTNNLMQDLNPSTQADLIRHMQDGSITDRVKELANPQSAEVYMSNSEEVGQALKRSTDLVVSKLGTQFFTQRTAGALSTAGGRGRTQSLGEFYRFDTGQNQFVLRNPNVRAVQNADTVRGLNAYIGNVMKAYQNLGLTNREQELKQELAELFGEDSGQEGTN